MGLLSRVIKGAGEATDDQPGRKTMHGSNPRWDEAEARALVAREAEAVTGRLLLALAVLGALMACSNPQSMGHPHCIFCDKCLVCDPHPAHTGPTGGAR